MFKRYLFVIGYGACAMVPIGLLRYADRYFLPREFWTDMIATLWLGAAMGALLVLSHLVTARARWRQFHGPAASIDGGNFASIDLFQTIIVRRSCAETYELCKISVKGFAGAEIVGGNPAEKMLRVRTARSIGSYGEFIDFRLRPIGESFTELELRSQPVERLALLDHGRNLNNLRRVCDGLRDATEYVHPGNLVGLK